MPCFFLPASATARDWSAPHDDQLHAAEFPPILLLPFLSVALPLWQYAHVFLNLLTHLPTHSPHGPLPSPAFRSDPYYFHFRRELLVECGTLHFHDSNCETSETESEGSTSPSLPPPTFKSKSRSEAMKEGRYGQPFALFVFREHLALLSTAQATSSSPGANVR
jgi:hypothetical protein